MIGKSLDSVTPVTTAFLPTAVSFGGMALANLLQSEAAAGISPGADKKSVILLWQPGGPSHLDMWDMKPDAPVEYRGEFNSIPSDIPGYRVSELMLDFLPR